MRRSRNRRSRAESEACCRNSIAPGRLHGRVGLSVADHLVQRGAVIRVRRLVGEVVELVGIGLVVIQLDTSLAEVPFGVAEAFGVNAVAHYLLLLLRARDL